MAPKLFLWAEPRTGTGSRCLWRVIWIFLSWREVTKDKTAFRLIQCGENVPKKYQPPSGCLCNSKTYVPSYFAFHLIRQYLYQTVTWPWRVCNRAPVTNLQLTQVTVTTQEVVIISHRVYRAPSLQRLVSRRNQKQCYTLRLQLFALYVFWTILDC